MDENNPIEGLDPSQSVFDPLMDQTMPEGVEALRTTTTTTMYISGDENALEMQKLQEPVEQKPDDPFGILQAIDNFRLYQSQNNIKPNVGDINKLFPTATVEQKRQIISLYPDQFKEDLVYNQNIQDTYNRLKSEGKSTSDIIKDLEDRKIGARSGLMARFPDLFNEKEIQKDQVKNIEDQKLTAQYNKDQERLEKLKKQRESGVDFLGNKLSFDRIRKIDQEISELERDVDILGRKATERDYDTSKDFEPFGRKIVESRPELSDKDIADISKKIDPNYVTPIIRNVEEKSVFDMANTLVQSAKGIGIDDEDFIEVYKKGNYDPEKHSQYDQKLSQVINGFISEEIPIEVHKSFYDRNNISKEDIILRNKMIIRNVPNFNKGRIYSPEEIERLEAQAKENLLKNYGDVEFDELKRILGDNIRLEDVYNKDIRESMYTRSKLDNAIVIDDEDATLRSLQDLFPESEGGFFRFSTRTDGKESIIIRTFFEGDVVNSMEINLSKDNEPIRKIREFMAGAMIPANVQQKMSELNRGEGEFIKEDGSIDKIKLSLYATKYPDIFGDAAAYSAYDLGAEWSKSPFMINAADIRKNIAYQESLVNNYAAEGRKDVDLGQLDMLETQAAIALGIHQQKKKQKGGGLPGLFGFSYLGGVAPIIEFFDDQITNVQALFGDVGLSDEEYNDLRSKGYSRDDIIKLEKRYIKEETESILNNIVSGFSGETRESIQEQGFLAEALSSAIESLSTGAVGMGSRIATLTAFALRSQASLENELKDTDLSDTEKFALTLPMAILEGVLEEFGLQKAIKPGLSKTRKMILSKALKEIPKDASPEVIRESIKRAINELSGGGLERVVKAGVAESLTELGQTAAEINLKTLANEIAGKELFQDVPNMFTAEGFMKGAEEILYSAALGGISGSGINIMSGTASSLANGFTKDSKDVSMNEAFDTITDDESRDILFSTIDIKVKKGEITESDAINIKENINNAYPLMMQIPAEFNQNQKEQAYNLLLERKKLQEQVDGKDKDLVASQSERINEINKQLELISKGGFKDAVQESETKKEVLPDEQPEVGLQEVGERDTEQEITQEKKVISPETSSNYANLTEDEDGNFIFFHVGDKGFETIKPASGKTKATSREEAAALSKVGGMAMLYTQQTDGESMVTGDARYAIKVPKSKVYDFNSDTEGYIEEARERHDKENPGMAFDPNSQVAYVAQIAAENGYDVVVSEWDGRTRAQSVKELQVSDVQTKEGNKVTKSFDEKYVSNKEKGFESVIPANKEDQLEDVYQKIKNEKGNNKEYDETYFLFDTKTREKNYSQEQITKMINESNLSQELKDEYNAIMEAKPEQRRSEKVRDNIAGIDIKYPNAQEEQQRKEERTKPEYVDNAAKQNQEEDVEAFQKELEGEFGMLTGENPLGKPLTEEENQQLNKKAEEWLKSKGYKPRRVTGKYGQAENSFFVPGLTKKDAIAFAKEFNQESVAHSDGMIFQDGRMNPRVKSKDNFKMDQYTPESDFVSVINTKDGLKTFVVGYDFQKKVDSTPKKKVKPKKDTSAIKKLILKARTAISKILPDVEIVEHETEDSYRKATGETDTKKQTSRGEYNPRTKKIHINLSKANNRTVAHEVFHAILLEKVKTDKQARDLTERMIKSLSKNLEGMPTVKEALDKFAENYDENIQSEEKLAELVGILAENYGQLDRTNKSLIKRFLDRLAKMFGLKPFTDNEVVDVLNAIAGKVAVGEEISDVDVKVLSQGASTFVAEPTTIQPKKQIGKKVVASNKPAELSFVTKKDLIDIESLVKEIADKKQKVWFWVADQMGRGMYSDVVVDGQHFLDAGPSYALDPVNRSKDIIWATGKDKSEIEKLIGQSDFIFIISGSPISSKLFNKKNIDILEERIGDYSKFKKDLLKSKPTKPIRDILNKHNSWNSLKESPDRKKLLLAFENQKDKNTATKKVLSKYNAFIDFNSLRDGFYKENDFKMNEVMLVLKPTAYGGKSNHSTYENDILGEVIGVPDAKVDSFDLMPEAIRKKYSETLSATQKTQVVAPYGIGVKEIESPAKRKQKGDESIEPELDILPIHKRGERITTRINEDKPISVLPLPERFLKGYEESTGKKVSNKDKNSFLYKLGQNYDYQKGGVYIDISDKKQIKGYTATSGSININPENGRASLSVSEDMHQGEASKEGRTIKTNLFKKKAGWSWKTDYYKSKFKNIETLVSVETGGHHVYTLGFDATTPMDLKNYPEKKSEPRLRPTTKGQIFLGNYIGDIVIRGKQHPVYDKVYSFDPSDSQTLDRLNYIYKKSPTTYPGKYYNFYSKNETYKKLKYYPEKSLKDRGTDSHEYVFEKLGIKDAKYIAGGVEASVYDIGRGRVLRFSMSPSNISNNLVNKKIEGIIPVYSTGKVMLPKRMFGLDERGNVLKKEDRAIGMKTKEHPPIYYQILKKGNTLNVKEDLDALLKRLFTYKRVKGIEILFGSSIEYQLTNLSDAQLNEFKKVLSKSQLKDLERLIQINKAFSDLGVKNRDSHTGNFVRNSNGDLEAIDLGIVFMKPGEQLPDVEEKNIIRKQLAGEDINPENIEPEIDIRDLKEKSDKKIKETNKGKGPILRRLRRALFDRQNDIKRIVKDFVPDPKRVSKIINAIVTKAGASGYANEMFKQQDKKIFSGLKSKQIENLELIIYARRIVAINENRRERGMDPYIGMGGLTEKEAILNLDKIAKEIGFKEFSELSKRADAYFEAFKKNLEMLKDSGRITEETYENLKDIEYSPIKTLKYILPQDTVTDEEINKAVSTLGVNKKDIMKLSDMNENEILFDARFLLMMNTNIVVRRSFENRMLNEFAQGYESMSKETKEEISDFIKDGSVEKIPPGFTRVVYFKDGKEKSLVMREDYARQLRDIKDQNKFLGSVGKYTGANILRFFATGGNPLFIIGNTAVDFANIALFSDVYSNIKPLAGIQLAYDFVKNFMRKAFNSKSYNKIKMEFMEHGGAMDFLSTDGLRMVQEMRLKNKILNAGQKALSSYAKFMSYIGETGEMSFRIAVYEKVKNSEIKKFEKENGRSPNQQEMEDIMFEAAAQSRETIDFTQGGTWVKQMDQALPYFNAAMQGLRRPLDFARKNPVAFTSNVIQYTLMTAGLTATSLASLLRNLDDDDDEEKKRIKDALDSISEYEKANYHIIFTGKKDKDGNYQYVRIKKLPLISILGTATEQYTTKYLLKSKGIDYEYDSKAVKKSMELSAPLDPSDGFISRNPLGAAWLTYTYNKDTFTGEKVFYEPRDRKVKPYAEGLYSDDVADIYKVIAPYFNMSPARTQAAVEKMITNENTNPSIAVFYMITNGMFDTKSDEFKENAEIYENGLNKFLEVVGKKLVRYTNPNILKYKEQDRLESLEKNIDTDAYLTKVKIKKTIKRDINTEKLRNGTDSESKKELEKLEDILKKYNIEDETERRYYGSYAVRLDLKGNETFKEMADIIYERDPKMMASRLFSRYGNSLDKEELKELSENFNLAKASNTILKKGYYYYEKNYLNKSKEQIDKFESKFGKVR